MTLIDVYKMLQEAGIPVWHNEAKQEETPYIVYQELSSHDMWISGQPYEESITMLVAHFTDIEFDPSLDDLKNVLRKNKIPFKVAYGYDLDKKISISEFSLTIVNEVEAAS